MAIDPITGKEKKEKLLGVPAVNPAINDMARKTLGGVVDPYAEGSVLRKAQDKQFGTTIGDIAKKTIGGKMARAGADVMARPFQAIGIDYDNQNDALAGYPQRNARFTAAANVLQSSTPTPRPWMPDSLKKNPQVLGVVRQSPDVTPISASEMAPTPLAQTNSQAGMTTVDEAIQPFVEQRANGTTPRDLLLGSPTKTLYSNPGGRMVANDVPITRPTANTARETILGRTQRIGNLDVSFDGMPADERARFTDSANLEARRTIANPKSSMITSIPNGLSPLMNSGPSTPAAAQSFGDLFVQGLQSKRDRSYAGINDANEKNRIALLGQNQQLGIAGMNDATSRRAQDMTAADAAVRNGIQATTAASNAAHTNAQIEGLTTDAAAKRQVMGDANSLNIERQRLAGLNGDARAIQEQKIADLTGQKSEPFKIADTSSIDPNTQLPIKNAYMVDAKGNIKKIGDDQPTALPDRSKMVVGQIDTLPDGRKGRWNGNGYVILK